MLPRSVTALALAASLALVACGSATDATGPAARTSRNATSTPSVETAPGDGKQRAGVLLDDWSATLIKAVLTAQKRGKVAQADDRDAYKIADADLRPLLAKVKHFAPAIVLDLAGLLRAREPRRGAGK